MTRAEFARVQKQDAAQARRAKPTLVRIVSASSNLVPAEDVGSARATLRASMDAKTREDRVMLYGMFRRKVRDLALQAGTDPDDTEVWLTDNRGLSGMSTLRRSSDSHRANWAPTPYEWDRREPLRNHLERNQYIQKLNLHQPTSVADYRQQFATVAGEYPDINDLARSPLRPIRAALRRGDCVAAQKGLELMKTRAQRYVSKQPWSNQADADARVRQLLRGITAKVGKACTRKHR